MLRGVFGRVSALIETVRNYGLEGPDGRSLEHTEQCRQETMAEIFEDALARVQEQTPSGEEISHHDLHMAIRALVEQDSARKLQGVHYFGEITENDVLGHWHNLPRSSKAELGLIERTQAEIGGDETHRKQPAKASAPPEPAGV